VSAFLPGRVVVLALFLWGCSAETGGLGDACDAHSDCASNLCAHICVAPDGDLDGDELSNALEQKLGSKLDHPDSDGDGLQDGYEAGPSPETPLDSDGDGVADLLESNIADPDQDCLVNARDPQNTVSTTDQAILISVLCSQSGVCGLTDSKQSVECAQGSAICTTEHTSYQTVENLCDGLDNDCDGTVDEGQAWKNSAIGTPCDGTGECGSGIVECDEEGKTRCSTNPGGSENQATAELCNQLDDDCDGELDNDLRLYGRPDGPTIGGVCAGTGICIDGIVECDGGGSGQVICSTDPGGSHHLETTELCNGLDDNCDGSIDDGFLLLFGEVEQEIGAECGVGACANGTVICAADGLHAVCSHATKMSDEVCNGVDDDCDGETDESSDLDVGQSGCSSQGVCASSDVMMPTCTAGQWECVVNPDSTYEADVELSCDGVDNNCDGQIDEPFLWTNPLLNASPALSVGVSCGTGNCQGGTVLCSADGTGALCSSMPASISTEICDGADNDCDGLTDNGQTYNELSLGSPCDGVGDCGLGIVVCSPNDGVATCSTNSNGTTPQAAPEGCNQVDDDCDGLTDEAADLVVTPLTCAAPGICQQGTGTPLGCVDGIWLCDLSGIAGYEAANEVSCDGLDNDCDGLVDEWLSKEPDNQWQTLHPGTPPARTEAIAAFDPNGQQIIVVGGGSPSANNESSSLTDVWAFQWDATPRWTQLEYTAPPRSGASLTYSAVQNSMHLFGGRDKDGKTTNTLWALSFSEQSTSMIAVPATVAARAEHSAVVNPDTGWLWIFGGVPTGLGSSVATWNPATNQWTTGLPDGPGWRAGMATVAVPDNADGRIVAFGGSLNGIVKGDTWILDLASLGWIPVKPDSAPSPRSHHRMVRHDQNIYLFGGQNSAGEVLGDLWRFNLDSLNWTQLFLAGGPTPRKNSSFVGTDNELVLLGGMNAEQGLLDGWRLSSYPDELWTALKVGDTPRPRVGATLAITEANGLLLYGGVPETGSTDQTVNEVWRFQPSPTPSWTLESVDGPLVQYPATAFDRSSQTLYVHGGLPTDESEPALPSHALWQFSEGSWSMMVDTESTGPSLMHHGAAWHPTSKFLLLYGGESGTDSGPVATNDVWRWTPENGLWELVLTLGDGPLGMVDPSLFFNPATQQWVVVGNANGATRIFGLHATSWTWSSIAQLQTTSPLSPALGLITASNALLISEPGGNETKWRWVDLANGQHSLWSLSGPVIDTAGARFAYNPWGGNGFLFGGRNADNSLRNSVFTLPFSCTVDDGPND